MTKLIKNTGRRIPVIKVKLFDHEHEKDLEKDMNHFLEKIEEKKLLDIKYNVAAVQEDEDEQIYCFSAMVIYRA
nr:sporulation protein Cse60 [Cytobacillus firmus]